MSTEIETIQRVLLRESLRKQLEEYEMLQSIYSMPGEFQSDNPFLVNDIQEFLTGNRSSVDEKLDFRIKVQLTEGIKLELSVMLGQLYPTHEMPIFIVRTDFLNRSQETLVKQAMESYIETEVDKDEPYIYQVLNWLQDSIESIVMQDNTKSNSKLEENLPVKLERVWIWSHHIYSKIKRQNIKQLCKNHDLSGFMWSGKPGVICIEGVTESVEDVVKAIKSWQWQKIKIVRLENSDGNEQSFVRFQGFEEILTGSDEDGEDVKMDTGMFFKYLDAHQSSNMKMELFGFD